MLRAGSVASLALVLGLLAGTAAPAQEKKIVRIWQTEMEPQTLATLNQIAADFEKQRPGVSVKIEALPWTDLATKLTAAMAAGAPPEAAHGQPSICTYFAANGVLRPVDDLVESLGKDNLIDGLGSLCRVEGKSYGVGHAVSASMFVVRKDLLAQKGLKPPRTWDEVIRVAEALKDVKDGQVRRWGLTMSGHPLVVNGQVSELLRSNGGRLVDDEGRPTLTEKPVIELLDFYRKLNTVLPPGWTGQGYLDTLAQLINGKAAMVYQAYGRAVGYIETYAPPAVADPEHFAVIDKPVGPSGKESVAQIDAKPWMVFKNAKHAEEGVAFLKFLYRDEQYIRYLHTVPIHLLPVTRSTYRAARYADNPTLKKWRPWMEMQEAYLKGDRGRPALVMDWDDMKRLYLPELMGSSLLVEMVQDVVKGTTPAEAAAKAQKRLEELLVKGGYLKK